MNAQRCPTPHGALQFPQNYLQTQTPIVLQNPIPHQVIITTQQEACPPILQMGQYTNPDRLNLEIP
jgi:hypothetical protein